VEVRLGHQVFVQENQRRRGYRPRGDEEESFQLGKLFRSGYVMDDIGERGGVAYTGTRAVIFELLPVVIEDWSGVVVVGGHGEERATHICLEDVWMGGGKWRFFLLGLVWSWVVCVYDELMIRSMITAISILLRLNTCSLSPRSPHHASSSLSSSSSSSMVFRISPTASRTSPFFPMPHTTFVKRLNRRSLSSSSSKSPPRIFSSG